MTVLKINHILNWVQISTGLGTYIKLCVKSFRYVTIIPSKQSSIGDKYTFPAGRSNSVISERVSGFV